MGLPIDPIETSVINRGLKLKLTATIETKHKGALIKDTPQPSPLHGRQRHERAWKLRTIKGLSKRKRAPRAN